MFRSETLAVVLVQMSNTRSRPGYSAAGGISPMLLCNASQDGTELTKP